MAVYDGILFYNELDLLELRMRELNDRVDYFVVCEATRTFSGKEKALYFKKARKQHRWRPFKNKIIHIVVDDMPVSENRWEAEQHQRNAIGQGFEGAQPDDIVMISDVDEIPFPWRVGQIGVFGLDTFYYTFYYRLKWDGRGTTALPFKDFPGGQAQRNMRDTLPYLGTAAWHFSYFYDPSDKISAFSHHEFDTPEWNDPDRIATAQSEGKDLFNRYGIEIVQGVDHLPRIVRENPEQWEQWLK